MATPKIPEALAIKATPQDLVPITLVGKSYNVKTPKGWLAMKMAVVAKQAEEDPSLIMETLEKWIEAAFLTKAPQVLKRLEDPKDELDISHIMELVEKLAERSAMTERPTS